MSPKNTSGFAATQGHLPTEAQPRCSDYHGLAPMNTPRKRKTKTLDQEGIDRLVVSQASDASAWDAPMRVQRSVRPPCRCPVNWRRGLRFWPSCTAKPALISGLRGLSGRGSNLRNSPSKRRRRSSHRSRHLPCPARPPRGNRPPVTYISDV